ncbi:hypothetical protein A5880_003055 [Enterococcus sp. 4G2_DIV0659]
MKSERFKPIKIGLYMIKWLIIASVIGVLMGSLSAFF